MINIIQSSPWYKHRTNNFLGYQSTNQNETIKVHQIYRRMSPRSWSSLKRRCVRLASLLEPATSTPIHHDELSLQLQIILKIYNISIDARPN